MFCKKCGNELKDGEQFCSKCGQAVNTSKQKKNTLLTVIICIVIIVGIIIALCIIADNQWKSSGEYGYQKAEETLNNNSNISESIKQAILEKWQVTLPLNNTNGLEMAMYYVNTDELYLKYNFGICVVDRNDNINRYVQGDYEFSLYNKAFDNATESEDTILMTANEFNQLIGQN